MDDPIVTPLENARAPLVTITIPAYNEEANLIDSAAEVARAAEQLGLDYEIIIIDDGSDDGTYRIATDLAARNDRIRAYRNEVNLGLGGAYKRGLEFARGAYYTWVPGDCSHPADGLVSIWRALGGADIVVPVVTNPMVRSRLRRLLSTTYTRLVNTMFGLDVPYYNGLVVHRTERLRSIEIRTNGFAFQTEALVKLCRNGHEFVTAPTVISDRATGRSGAFKLRNLAAVAATLLRLMRDRGTARGPDAEDRPDPVDGVDPGRAKLGQSDARAG